MYSFWSDLRYAIRALGRQRTPVLLAVAVIALGVGATTAVFSAVRAVLLRPLPYAAPDRLVVLQDHHAAKGLHAQRLPPARYFAWRDARDIFADVAAYDLSERNLSGSGEAERVDVARVSASVFTLTGIRPVVGRAFSTLDERAEAPAVAIVSHGLWQRRFEGGAIEGRSVRLDGQPFAIVGVMPPAFRLPPADVYVPLVIPFSQSRVSRHLYLTGRLAGGLSLADARARVDRLAAGLQAAYPATDQGWTTALVPLRDAVVGDVAPALRLLLGAAGLVLLVGCASVANLLLVRAVARRREFAIRVALGASRGRLAGQVLTESALVAIAGGIAGLALAAFMAPALRTLSFARFDDIRVDAGVLAFTIVAAALTALLSGIGPALLIVRTNVAPALASSSGRLGGGPRRAVDAALVVIQLALAVVLVSGAMLLASSLRNLASADPGFRAEGVFTARVTLPWPRYRGGGDYRRFERELVERVRTLPAVTDAAVVNLLPLSGRSEPFNIHVDGAVADTHAALPSAEMRSAGPGYFRAMGIPVVAGRIPDERDAAGSPQVLVVNRTMASRFWPEGGAVGRRVSLDGPAGPWLTIVGVVGDVKHAGLAAEVPAEMYRPYAQEPRPRLTLVVRALTDPGALTPEIRRVIASIDPELAVYDVRRMDELLSSALMQPRLQTYLAAAFALLALVLAVAGVYGVMSNAVARRAPEIAIRMVLGCAGASVVALVMRRGTRIVAAGVALGAGGAWTLSQVMSSLLFEVDPTDSRMLAATSAVVALAAAAACYFPARRASRIDAVTALRGV